jgi:hypothetical protein
MVSYSWCLMPFDSSVAPGAVVWALFGGGWATGLFVGYVLFGGYRLAIRRLSGGPTIRMASMDNSAEGSFGLST